MIDNFQEAISILAAELRKDTSEGSYYDTWKANIAMAIYDAWQWDKPPATEEAVNTKIHRVANEGAKRFLNLLMRER